MPANHQATTTNSNNTTTGNQNNTQRNQGTRQRDRRTDRGGEVVLDHQPARPCLVSCGGDRKRRSRLVVLALPGRSSYRPSPRARPPRASHSFDGSSPFMPRATLATMRGNGSWRSRPRRRSQSLATARLTALALTSLVACVVSRYTLPFLRGAPRTSP